MPETHHPVCAYPWYQLILTNDGGYQPCCYLKYGKNFYPSSRKEMADLFNSPEMMELRNRLSNHDIKGMPCEHCVATKTFGGKNIFNVGKDRPGFLNAIGHAVESFEKGISFLDYFPFEITLGLSQKCNLKCIMCTQSGNSNSLYIEYPVEKIKRAIKDISWKNLVVFGFSGGETFAVKDGIDLLNFVTEEAPSDTDIYMVTNGTLLKKYINLLDKIPRLNLQISIDGTKENYEKIRVGSSWVNLCDNLSAIAKIKTFHPLWMVHTICVVMKSSLSSMKDFIRISKEYADFANFMRIGGEFFFENIFSYPSLLEGIEWREKFEEAINYANMIGMTIPVHPLSDMVSELEHAANTPNRDRISGEIKRIERLCKNQTNPWNVSGRKKSNLKHSEVFETVQKFLRWIKRTNIVLSHEDLITLNNSFNVFHKSSGIRLNSL